MHKYVIALIVLITPFSPLVASTQAARPEQFGREWVHSHPFTLMALTLRDALFDLNRYRGSGFNTSLAWETQPGTLDTSSQANMPWIQRLQATEGATAEFTNRVNQLVGRYPHNVGFLLSDEPTTEQEMLGTGAALDWLRANHPESLAFSNVGGQPNYETHVDNYLNRVRPDVLMFDYYPFGPPGVEKPEDLTTYYRRLAIIRDKARHTHLPYWAFIQSYDRASTPYLSESDVRMQVFTSLTHGYTGLGYFTYDPASEEARALINMNGSTNEIYTYVASANAEVTRLGETLKLLKSTDLGYVSTNPVPAGLSTWDTGDGPYITSIRATNLGAVNGRNSGDLLVGYFNLDREELDGTQFQNEVYFMVTNLLRAHDASATAARQSIEIRFDFQNSGITSLQRLNRQTGQIEIVPLIHDGGSIYHFNFMLDGGTGDLFKFNTGAPFVVPEPTALGMLMPTLSALALVKGLPVGKY